VSLEQLHLYPELQYLITQALADMSQQIVIKLGRNVCHNDKVKYFWVHKNGRNVFTLNWIHLKMLLSDLFAVF
jgi:hypothetical protein